VKQLDEGHRGSQAERQAFEAPNFFLRLLLQVLRVEMRVLAGREGHVEQGLDLQVKSPERESGVRDML
jgi:hypothetical protein